MSELSAYTSPPFEDDGQPPALQQCSNALTSASIIPEQTFAANSILDPIQINTKSPQSTGGTSNPSFVPTTATLDYGDGHTTTMDEVNVYNAKFSVIKYDSSDSNSTEDETQTIPVTVGDTTTYYKPLSGAGFVIEKTVPAGYNKAADSTFTIEEENYEGGNLIQSSTVENNQGTELPSTGGIGTTIFYVLGTILVLAAGVLLVTRRRMRHTEE